MITWNINIVAPTGAFDAVLQLVQGHEGTTGEMIGKRDTGPMMDLEYGESAITWSSKIERPMPMKLKFKGTHDGQTMTGTVKFGVFATGTFNGTRAE